MTDEPQTHTVSEFLLDFGAAIGWGMTYPSFLAGFFLISNQIKFLLTGIPFTNRHTVHRPAYRSSTGIPFIRGADTRIFLPLLPERMWLQTLIVLAIGGVLIGSAAALYPPCARRLLDRKLMQVNDDLIWY